jgi:hypothetical protein
MIESACSSDECLAVILSDFVSQCRSSDQWRSETIPFWFICLVIIPCDFYSLRGAEDG